MEYRLELNGRNINHIALNLSWSSNKDTLGQELSFDVPFDDTKEFSSVDVQPGDKVTLHFKTNLIFFGVIVEVEYDGRNPRKCKCFDLAFYLNKSKTTIQFNKIPASTAIQQVLGKFGIKNTVTSIPVQIDKIYKTTVISDIIKDILTIAEEQSGNRYRFEMRGDTLVIFNWRDIHINANVRWIQSPQRTLSIENMRNSIEIVADNEKMTKVLATAEDSSNVAKYGLLKESQTIDEKEMPKAKNVAQQLLKEMNRVQESGKVSLLGHYDARAGRLITLNEPITGLIGTYYITDAQHTISNGIHLMNLSLEVV